MTEKDFRAAESIIHFVVKGATPTLQKHDPVEEYRIKTLFARDLTYKADNFCSELYINVPQLTPWQLKTLKLRAGKALPDRWQVVDMPHLKAVRIVFK